MDPQTLGMLIASLVVAAALSFLLFSKKSPPAAQTPPKPEPKGYTRAEISKHNKEGDLWLILRTKGSERLRVYDLTDYADEHPGGEAIFNTAGGDATEGFFGAQHPPTVHELIPEYYIGWVLDE